MNTRTKTIPVAVYPDGRRVVLVHRGGMWYWDRQGSASSHLSAAIRNVEAKGGTVVREPNPNYRPRRAGRLTYADEAFARLFA